MFFFINGPVLNSKIMFVRIIYDAGGAKIYIVAVFCTCKRYLKDFKFWFIIGTIEEGCEIEFAHFARVGGSDHSRTGGICIFRYF